MTDRAGDDLLDGNLGTGQTLSVIVGRQIADKGGDAVASAERTEDFFQERRLAGSGTRYEADNESAGLVDTRPQRACGDIVLLENVLPNLDQARVDAHVSTSMA